MKPNEVIDTIKNIQEKQNKMEFELRTSIAKIMRDFEKDTGLTPNFISVNLIETSQLGQTRKHYILSDVKTSIEL